MNKKEGLLILLIMSAWSTVYCTEPKIAVIPEIEEERKELIHFIFNNNYAEAKLLLANGLNPNFTMPHTPLTMSVFMNSRRSFDDKKKLITLLLAHGADINLSASHGYNPLCYAINMNDLNLVQFLLEQGANPLYGKVEIGNGLQVNALEYAHHLKHTAIVDLLEKYGAAMNDQTHIDNTIDEFNRATGI